MGFIPLPEAKINKTVVKGRFIFLDRHGRTADATDSGASSRPLGVVYYDAEVGSTVNRGYTKYYGYNYPGSIYLELASACSVNDVLQSTDDGRAYPAQRTNDTLYGYARATESGEEGDIIHVLVQYSNEPVVHAFSTGFDYLRFY